LNTVCEYFGIELNHHDALSDARGACLIALNAMAALEDFDLQLLIDKLDLRIGYII
jgi:DNA polymerase-3 subunit epsilon